jgi:hypothetical protein
LYLAHVSSCVENCHVANEISPTSLVLFAQRRPRHYAHDQESAVALL